MSAFRSYCALFLLLPAAPAYSQLTSGHGLSLDNNSVFAYLEKSRTYEQTEPDSAVHYCSLGMKQAESRNDLKGQALLLLQLGRINGLHHHTDLSRKFINESLSILRILHDREGIAMAYDELGILDGRANDIAAAAADFGRSMKFYEDSRDSAGITATYHNLGEMFEAKGDTEKALTYYLRALIQYEHRSQKPEDYFVLLEQIGSLYAKKGDRMTALHYLEEGVRNSDTPFLRTMEVDLLGDEGEIEEAGGENTRALFYYKKELDAAKRSGNFKGQVTALSGIAHILKKDSAGRSLDYLKEALAIAQSTRLPQLKANIYQALADIYSQQKNFREALAVQEEYSRLVDSLTAANARIDIAAFDSSYALEVTRENVDKLQEVNKIEKKELELGAVLIMIIIITLFLLWLYLWKIKRLNRKLQESNEVRNTLFSIIGHDLKGPAGNAVQLLELMEGTGLPEEMKKKLLTELKKQSIASLELLTSLFEWGRAQLHGVEVRPETFATRPLIQKNIMLLAPMAAQKNIVMTDGSPADVHIYADPNQFDFVVRNLLSNAIKFTHEGGAIDIQARMVENKQAENKQEIIFSVRDTGIGISPEKQQAFLKTTLPVSFGTKGEKGSGLGLLLIKEFMRANHGRIWLESKEGEGTTFYFSFPFPIQNQLIT